MLRDDLRRSHRLGNRGGDGRRYRPIVISIARYFLVGFSPLPATTLLVVPQLPDCWAGSTGSNTTTMSHPFHAILFQRPNQTSAIRILFLWDSASSPEFYSSSISTYTSILLYYYKQIPPYSTRRHLQYRDTSPTKTNWG